MAAGPFHSVVLKDDGTVYAAGANEEGQLGTGNAGDRRKFVQVFSSGAKAIVSAKSHILVLKTDGSVWSTGFNDYGQLGIPYKEDQDVYTSFVQTVVSGAQALATGEKHSLVLKKDGTVWGTGSYTLISDDPNPKNSESTVFTLILGPQSKDAEFVAAGQYHRMVLKKDGSVWASGNNDKGQLGDGSTVKSLGYKHVVSSGENRPGASLSL